MAIEATRRTTIRTSSADDRRTPSMPAKPVRDGTMIGALVASQDLTMAERAERAQALLDAEAGVEQARTPGIGGHPTTANQLSEAQYVTRRNQIMDGLRSLLRKHGASFEQSVLTLVMFQRDADQAFHGPQGLTAAGLQDLAREARKRIKAGGSSGAGPA